MLFDPATVTMLFVAAPALDGKASNENNRIASAASTPQILICRHPLRAAASLRMSVSFQRVALRTVAFREIVPQVCYGT
jgi:hypothetical protein